MQFLFFKVAELNSLVVDYTKCDLEQAITIQTLELALINPTRPNLIPTNYQIYHLSQKKKKDAAQNPNLQWAASVEDAI